MFHLTDRATLLPTLLTVIPDLQPDPSFIPSNVTALRTTKQPDSKMNRPLPTVTQKSQLLKLSELLSTTVHTIVEEWGLEREVSASSTSPSTDDLSSSSPSTAPALPSPRLYEAQRTIAAIAGKLTELVSEPSARVIEIGCQYWETRALYVAVERRVPDLLAEGDGMGMRIGDIAGRTGIEERKLGRWMRLAGLVPAVDGMRYALLVAAECRRQGETR